MPPKSAPRSGGGSYLLNSDLSWSTADGAEMSAARGETRSDVPEQSVPWLVEQGLITPTSVVDRVDALKAAARGEKES